METYDLTSIEIGKQIFDDIPNDIIPGWAGLVLSRFDNYINFIPKEIKELYPIINDKNRWKDAHEQFSKIRMFLLNNKNYVPESYLLLAEIVAKVTYNSTGGIAPFDADSGWYIPRLAMNTASLLKSDDIEDEVKTALLLFKRNKRFKNDLQSAQDFIIYKKIDDILWFDWDPIGVNNFAPRDEYQSYITKILNLKKSGADRNVIAQLLYTIETERMGLSGNFEKCLTVADKVIITK